MRKMILLMSGLFAAFCFSVQAQSDVNAAGGEATGSGGSASYSIGQVFDQMNTSASGTVSEGVQQPFEILTTDVEDIEEFLEAFRVYPNPVKQILYLQKKSDDGIETSYRLIDLNGNVLKAGILDGELHQIDMQGYAPSAYFLEIIRPKKKPQTIKIIKH